MPYTCWGFFVPTFPQALIEEEKWLANIIGQPFPADDQAGRRVYLGPTAFDFTMLPEIRDPSSHSGTSARIPPNEQAMLKKWRAASNDYLHGHGCQPYFDPRHPNRSF